MKRGHGDHAAPSLFPASIQKGFRIISPVPVCTDPPAHSSTRSAFRLQIFSAEREPSASDSASAIAGYPA